jgi:hypothetical protein
MVGPEEHTDMNNGSCCTYLTERDHLEDLDKDGINIKRGLKEEGWKGIKCIYAIQERDRCSAVVNMITSHWVP